jgi:hypothetical protein
LESIRTFFHELVRRRVLRTAGLYLVAVWGVSQGAAEIFPLFGASEDDVRLFIFAALALLPVVVVLSWMYDLTGHGPERDAGPERAVARPPAAAETTLSVSLADLPDEHVRIELRDGERDEVALQVRDFIIGREDGCAVRFEDPAVSRSHARVFHRGGRWRIRDLGSTNGTWLDGRRIREADLPGRCRVRVNEVGPTLYLALVSASEHPESAGLDVGRTLVARTRPRPD